MKAAKQKCSAIRAFATQALEAREVRPKPQERKLQQFLKDPSKSKERPVSPELVPAEILGTDRLGKKQQPSKLYYTSLDHKEVLGTYEKLREDGVRPNVTTFLAALKACLGLRNLQAGRRVHSHIIEAQQEGHSHVANTLVDMYAKCGSMAEARRVFDGMNQRSVVSWNAILMGYASNGEGDLALELFAKMQDDGFEADSRIFIAALKACTSLATKEEATQVAGKYVKTVTLSKGRSLHSELAKRNYGADLYVSSTLVDLYAKCGSMVDARKVFEEMDRHDVVSWTAVILGYAESGEGKLALQLFSRMQDEGFKPDARIFVAALKACGSVAGQEEGGGWKAKCLETGVVIHNQLAKAGYESNVYVAGSLVDMYARCGSIEDSRRVFDKTIQRSVVLWNSVIMAYGQSGEEEEALKLFEQMKSEGCVPDSRTFVVALTACTGLAGKEEGREADGKFVKVRCLERGVAIHREAVAARHENDIFVANCLLEMYSKCGSMAEARQVFDKMKTHTPVSWNSMILGYVQNGEEEEALELFGRMKDEGCVPSGRHYIAALKACGALAALEAGKKIHEEIVDAGFGSDAMVTNTLVHFYGRCGSMVDAEVVFDEAVTKELVTWNALIAGYTHQGDSIRVFDLFERMKKQQIQPNGITFLLILNACTHAGLVDKGKEVFNLVSAPTLEHYTCMVDLLGRANHLEDAMEMVRSMPWKPDATLWRAVLGACQKWNNVEVAKIAFDSILKLDDEEPTPYVLMANIYSGAEMWEESAKVEEALRRQKKKTA